MEKQTFRDHLRSAMFIITLALLWLPIIAQKDINMGNRFQINKDGSYLTFKTTLAGFPVIRGAAKAYQATMFYDPEDVMSTSATIRIAADGISTAHDKRDEALLGEHFLNASEFPGIWFQGSEVKPTDQGFDLSGTLHIKNINKPATIHLEKPTIMPGAMNKQDLMVVKGSLSINRKEFGLGTTGHWAANPMLGEEIEIEFTFMGFSYTIEYLKATFERKIEDRDHAVGLVYNEVKANGVQSGLKLVEALAAEEAYQKDNWLTNLANIGWMLMVDGLGKESLPFYEMALKQNPEHLSSLLRLGDAYTIAGEHQKALTHYKKEWTIPARARFTHIPHMIKSLSDEFDLKDMK